MSIVTKTGDHGETSLWHGGRVKKTDPRIIAVGKIDTFSASLGLVLDICYGENYFTEEELIKEIQRILINIMGEIASEKELELITEEDLLHLEKIAKYYEKNVKFSGWSGYNTKNHFISRLDFSSRLCREAELAVWETDVRVLIKQFLNRLSDVLYLIARSKEKNENTNKKS